MPESMYCVGGMRRVRALFSLPTRNPHAFWISAAFVMVVGVSLAVRNYCGHRAKGKLVAATTTIAPYGMALLAPAPADDATQARGEAQDGSPLPKLFLSLAVTVFASLLAGFSIAQLLDRPVRGFRS